MEKRGRFYEQFEIFLAQKKLVSLFPTDKLLIIKEFLQNPSEGKWSSAQHNWINRYYLKEVAGTIHIFYKSNNRQMVTIEEVYDIIDRAHTRTQHGGRDILKYACRNFGGIPQEAYQMYLNLCEQCELKKVKIKKGIVVKPILSSEMNSRCQVDLIDMQAQSFESFNYILVYQDHLTKFVMLKPLKTKTAQEVAKNLVEIFGIFGAPKILHTDNGREFANQVIKNLLKLWPECKLVHGKPRHSQSQGSVERTNRDIEDMLATYCSENNSRNWVDALPIIQTKKNGRLHSGIGRPPYVAMFGRDMKIGISDEQISPDMMNQIESEEDLAAIYQSPKTNKLQPEEELVHV